MLAFVHECINLSKESRKMVEEASLLLRDGRPSRHIVLSCAEGANAEAINGRYEVAKCAHAVLSRARHGRLCYKRMGPKSDVWLEFIDGQWVVHPKAASGSSTTSCWIRSADKDTGNPGQVQEWLMYTNESDTASGVVRTTLLLASCEFAVYHTRHRRFHQIALSTPVSITGVCKRDRFPAKPAHLLGHRGI